MQINQINKLKTTLISILNCIGISIDETSKVFNTNDN